MGGSEDRRVPESHLGAGPFGRQRRAVCRDVAGDCLCEGLAYGLGVVWCRGGVEDLVRSPEDAVAGGVDDVCDGGAFLVVGEGLFGPAGDVGEGVLAAVEAVGGGDE